MSQEAVLGKKVVFEGATFWMKNDKALSDTESIEKVLSGDKEAYEEIVSRYMKRAYYIALGFVHNSQDALDISQDAFIKTYRKIKKFDTQKPFFPWFYKLLKNLCLDHIKKSKKRKEVPLEGVNLKSAEKEDREMKEILWNGIEKLSIEQKEVILLRYFQQFSYQEIADVTEKPLGTVMSSLYYAKKRLKGILWKYLREE